MTLEQLLESLDLEAVPENHALDSTLEPTLAPRFREGKSVRAAPSPPPTAATCARSPTRRGGSPAPTR